MDSRNPNPNLSALVDPQSYAKTKQMIQDARKYISQVEAQNEVGFQAFAYTEQELQRRIREGREAEMLAAQISAGNYSQQQPQAIAWQMSSMSLPSVQQNFSQTSARIEEVPSPTSGRSSRLGPTFQPYEQSANYNNVPVQTTTYISHDFNHGQSSRRQSYYPPPTVHIPPVPFQHPPPPPVRQPPPRQGQFYPATSAPSPTSSHPVSFNNVPPPQSSTEQIPPTAQHEFVKHLTDFLDKHPPEVQGKVLSQILEYIAGKPTSNPQIRTWGDKLKQVRSSDPRELVNVVVNKLKALRVARSNQQKPQTQATPLPQPQSIQVPLPATQSHSRTTHSNRQSQPNTTGAAEKPADDSSTLLPGEELVLNKVLGIYSSEINSAQINGRRVGDIISAAYISARLKQPPNDPDVWVHKTLNIFEAHFPTDRIPPILEYLLQKIQRPIPDIPAQPRTSGYSSNSLAGALVDTAPNVTPSVAVRKPNVVSEPLGNGMVVETGAPESLPEAQIPQYRNLEPIPIPRTQTTEDILPTQPHPSSSIIPTNPPHATTATYTTSAVPGDASRRGYQPMNHNQLALVPRFNFSVIPNPMQGAERQPQAFEPVQYHPPEASTSTPLRQPPVKSRLPREADRSRLARDILKQLGKPNGSVPAIPTRREYKERKKAKAETEGLPVHPSTEPITEPSNRESAPSVSDPIPDQVLPGPLSSNQLKKNPRSELLSIGYPDRHKELPPDAAGVEQDVDMDIHSCDSLVPRPSTSPRPAPPQDFTPPQRDPELAQVEKGKSTAENPSSELRSSRWVGPPPDTEVIEISDDEGQPAVDVLGSTVEPMEVDGEVKVGGAISKSLSQLSLVGDDNPVEVEMENGHAEEQPPNRRSSQEPVASKDIQLTEKKSQKIRPYVEVPPFPDYVRRGKGKGPASEEAEDEEDPELQTIVDLAFSRLRSTRCSWLGCRATLNSVNNLIKHLKIHADEAERTSDHLECQWKKCTRSYRTRVKFDRHCVHHAQRVLHCPYEDCGEGFRDAGELLDHTRDMHENSDLLPSTNPVPYRGQTLDPLPEKIPSWTIFPASVAPVPISADRHSQIGRWVARNICETAKRADSSRRLPSSRRFNTGRQGFAGTETEEMMNEERFGFISSTEVDGNTMFANIPSEAVSLSCRYGQLVLSENDGHPLGNRRERSVIGDGDVEDGFIRADSTVEEDAISLELEPAPSDDELLLKPASS